MSKTKDKSKSREERLEEKEKIDAETQRSVAVAKMKKAHELIEATEKSRKRPILVSVCERIDHLRSSLRIFGEMYGKSPFGPSLIDPRDLYEIKNWYQTYESVRFDFQKSMKINDNEMEKLFPKIEVLTTTGSTVSSSFFHMHMQLGQMRLYCQRMLI